MNKIYVFVIVVFLILLGIGQSNLFSSESDFEKWEKDMQIFERWDSKNSFPDDAVLFVGSSSIKLWQTRNYFPDLKVINRGFGGSQIFEVTHFADRIIFPYKPKVILFYAGDNDIASGKSSERVFEDYKKFVKLVHGEMPGTPVIFVAIKPSLSRWKLWPEMKEANSMIKNFSDGNKDLFYFDSAKPLLGDDGKPRAELFMDDQLHLSSRGYHLWTEQLRPMIEHAVKCKQKCERG